jgi:hypothetical protein
MAISQEGGPYLVSLLATVSKIKQEKPIHKLVPDKTVGKLVPAVIAHAKQTL